MSTTVQTRAQRAKRVMKLLGVEILLGRPVIQSKLILLTEDGDGVHGTFTNNPAEFFRYFNRLEGKITTGNNSFSTLRERMAALASTGTMTVFYANIVSGASILTFPDEEDKRALVRLAASPEARAVVAGAPGREEEMQKDN